MNTVPCILIVDDQKDFAEGIAELLEMKGYKAQVAFSAKGALERAGAVDVAVALIDLRLGHASGLDLIEGLKSIRPGILCLIMTAYADVDTAIEAVHRGAYDYLRKPLSTGDLLLTLNRCLDRIRLEEEKKTAEAALREKNRELSEINSRLRKMVASTKGLATCAYLTGFGQLLLKEFSQNMAAEGGSIYMIREDRLTLMHTLDPAHSPSVIPFPLKKGSILQMALEMKEPLLIPDLKGCLDLEPSGWLGYQDGSILVFPLVDDSGETLGIVSLHNRVPPPFTEQDKELGTLLASHSCETIRALRAVEALKERERSYTSLFNNLLDVFFRIDLDGNIIDVSPSVEHTLGYPLAQARTLNLVRDLFSDPGGGRKFLALARERETVELYESVFRHQNGGLVRLSINARQCVDGEGAMCGVEGTARDVTRISMLESQLRQAQKMEAVGTLAGGIAHDFNNILSAIMGYAELAILDLPKETRTAQHLDKVLRASHRAKDLVSRILTFSRREEHALIPIDLETVILETLKLIRASLPATIEIRREIIAAKRAILADQTQLHQVIMNICANARHAMGEKGGILEIRLDEAAGDPAFSLEFPNEDPQGFLRMTIRDTGHGMPKEVADRIFDPYFTTKEKGEGTGLGLAIVQTIIQNHKGFIRVQSEPGVGTAFHLYFPHALAGAQAHPSAPLPEPVPGGSEKILVVDDEEDIVLIIRNMLARLGYQVTIHLESRAALEDFEQNPGDFDAIVSDVTMPEMTGDILAACIKKIRPDIPVILCTGYNELITSDTVGRFGGDGLLKKPVSMRDLAVTLRKLLDGGRAAGS